MFSRWTTSPITIDITATQIYILVSMLLFTLRSRMGWGPNSSINKNFWLTILKLWWVYEQLDHRYNGNTDIHTIVSMLLFTLWSRRGGRAHSADGKGLHCTTGLYGLPSSLYINIKVLYSLFLRSIYYKNMLQTQKLICIFFLGFF